MENLLEVKNHAIHLSVHTVELLRLYVMSALKYVREKFLVSLENPDVERALPLSV